MWRIVGGVIVGLVSSCLNALSYVVQKKAHLLNARSNRPIYKHPVWLIGFGLLLLGSIISLGMLCVISSDHGLPGPDHSFLVVKCHNCALDSVLVALSQRGIHALGFFAACANAHWCVSDVGVLEQSVERIHSRCKVRLQLRICSFSTSDPSLLFS